MSIPNDFPTFKVPGLEKQMETLRELYWLHYGTSGAKATMWDIWLPSPSLWPAVETDNSDEAMRKSWAKTLSARIIDADGYVATHQHASIAHPHGWPFPFWNQGANNIGWHFSFNDTPGPPWRTDKLSTKDGWEMAGAEDEGIQDDGWHLKLTAAGASMSAPAHSIDPFQSPFVQLRWRARCLGNAQPYLEWTTKQDTKFGPDRRVYFDPVETDVVQHDAIAVYKHPKWTGEITQLRVNFGNASGGASVVVQALFTQYDSRHDTNSQSFVRGCATYFAWTRDINFLRHNINRMRVALRYVMTEHQAEAKKVVVNKWVGHDGISGIKLGPDGKKEILYGHGIGDNYWDLLPFGNLDCYATVTYYEALKRMSEIEREVMEHPEWDVPKGVFAFDPDVLTKHAEEVKKTGNKLFWSAETGRFVSGIDADGKKHDYGFTFLNLEAIYYGFATPEHAKSIMSWISGERVIEGDTATGADIYRWRFGPRATTRRNIDHYLWVWSRPEAIPFGGQIQDGGAVLGFSYHDLMARLEVLGPDDAWKRMQETIRWFDEVQAAGGYRAYYDGSREGSMQGAGTAGGLGLDQEFFESVLVPQVVIDGFLGFAPTGDGFRIDPKLPSEWPELSVNRVRYHELTLEIRATRDAIEVRKSGSSDEPCYVVPPLATRKVELLNADDEGHAMDVSQRRQDGAVRIDWSDATGVRFER